MLPTATAAKEANNDKAIAKFMMGFRWWDVDPIVVNPAAATAKGIVDFNGESVYTHKCGIDPAAL